MNKIFNILMLIALLSTLISSCTKPDIEEPPYTKDYPKLNANFSIKDLQALHTPGAYEQIEEDYLIKAVIIADDKSGNYYKTLVVQDSTGGMEVKINAVNLFNVYPEGREIFIKMKGLYLGDYNGNFQIGGSTYLDEGDLRLGGIEEPYLNDYIVKGQLNVPLTPVVKTMAQLSAADVNTLIQLADVEVADADLGKSYADAVGQITANRTLKDCSGATITLRTSGFANFAGSIMPEGKGSIVAVYSIFGNTKQLFLRKTEDIDFSGTRCSGGTTGGELIDISAVRAMYSGSTLVVPGDVKIKGIVISDRVNNNITSKNIVIFQPGNAGITVRFLENNPFNQGDEVEINVSGMELSEFNGLLQLNNVPLGNTKRNTAGNNVTPTVLTIEALLANFELYESQLVTINGATLSKSGGNTYSGDVTMTDGTGTISLYTNSYALFSGESFPSGTVQVTGIVNQGGNQSAKQINVRSKSDVSGGTIDPPSGDVNEAFNSAVNNQEISISGWLNIAEEGARTWIGKTFNEEKYAQATSFNASDQQNIMWLISPAVTLDKPKVLTFETALQVYKHDGLEVLVSTNFDGTNYKSATWAPLSTTLAGSGTPDHQWVQSGAIDLSAFSGTLHIAFKYTGDAALNTTSYRVDNIVVKDK